MGTSWTNDKNDKMQVDINDEHFKLQNNISRRCVGSGFARQEMILIDPGPFLPPSGRI